MADDEDEDEDGRDEDSSDESASDRDSSDEGSSDGDSSDRGSTSRRPSDEKSSDEKSSDKRSSDKGASGEVRPRRARAIAKAREAAERATAARPRRRRPATGDDSRDGENAEDVAAAREGAGGRDDGAEPAPVTLSEERKARRALGMGGGLSALGLALVGTGPSEAGTVICVLGLLVLIYGIHTFGRLGPEPAK